jgi:hypothetical protein
MKKKAITCLSSVIGKPIRETKRSQKIAYILRNDLFPRDRIIKQQIELIKERKTSRFKKQLVDKNLKND